MQRTITPVNGSIYVERPLATDAAIESALSKAISAQAAWKRINVSERANICRRMTEWCVARADALGTELAWQMGRPIAYAPNELRRGFQERAMHMCDIAQLSLI